MAFLLVLVVLAIWQFSLRRFGLPRWAKRPLPNQSAWVGAVLLPLGFAAQLAAVGYAAAHDHFIDPQWLAGLPLHLAIVSLTGPEHVTVAAGIVAAVTAQTLGLIALAFGPRTRGDTFIVAAAGFVLAVLALSCPVLSSADVYNYAYESTVGFGLYTQTAVPATSPFHFLLPYIPLVGSIYGPLWIPLNGFAGSFGTTIHDKIVAIRAMNVVFVLVGAFAVHAMRFPRSIQIAFVLNPMIWFYFVVNAHNDIMTIALCFLAIAAARRYVAIAILCVAAAGAIKISYLLIGCVAFARMRLLRHRVAAAAAAVILSLAVSWLVGGRPYFDTLLAYAHGRGAMDPATTTISMIMTPLVILITVIALWTRRFFAGPGWFYPLASPLPFPWYLIWGLPYAAVRRRGFAAMLLLLPLGAALTDHLFGMFSLAIVVLLVVIVVVSIELLRGDPRFRMFLSPRERS